MSKKIVAVDIDDVLAANAEGFVAFSNERWGTNLRPADYSEHWAEVWKVDEAEAHHRSTELHTSGTIGKYEHFPAALPVLKALARNHHLVVVTPRRRIISDDQLKHCLAAAEVGIQAILFGQSPKICQKVLFGARTG